VGRSLVVMKNDICKQGGATSFIHCLSDLMVFPGGLNPAFRWWTDYS